MSSSPVNFKTLADNLLKISPRLHRKHTKRAVDKGGKMVLRKARSNAHAARDTGALSRALDQKTIMSKDAKGAVCYIGPDRNHTEPARKGRRTRTKRIKPSDYAHIVEFGSSTSSPKPFMRPAMDTAESNAHGVMAFEMRMGLDEVTRTLPSTPRL